MPAPKEYDPFEYVKGLYPAVAAEADQAWATYLMALYDPARIRIEVKLVALDDVEPYLYAAAKVEEAAEALREEGEEGGGGMLLGEGEGYTNHLWVGIRGPAQGLTNIEIAAYVAEGFTNRLEIFTCTNLLSFWWDLAATNLSTEGTNVVYWGYDVSGVESTLFFAVGNADVDTDGDGLADAREKFMHHTEPDEWDTDGDGVSDGEEVAEGTDPLDRYSNPPLDWLRAEGSQLVDESGRPVVLKSVNLGGWLEWEQWMLMFEPLLWTNEWGKVYGLKRLGAPDETDESAAREMLMANVDESVTLLAARAPLVSSGVTTGTVTGGWTWLCPEGVRYIGSFNGGRWIGFTNINFGSGVSNLAIALAVPVNDAGRQIRVRLGGPNGTEIGALVTKATAPAGLSGSAEWCTFTEQYLTLSTNLSGTHDIYFVGSNAASWQAVGNLYRFRFFNNATNTANLFETFRDNYFRTNDLDRIRELGYNCVRVPFFHTVLEDDNNPYVYKTSGWARLDWVIEECRKRHLWVILDLHSAPGGQNPYAASGLREPFRNRMWLSEFFKDRTEKLWAVIAARYATNSAVAGYDLFNEPDPPHPGSAKPDYQAAFSNHILPMVTRLHRAIRSNDTQHILFLESNLMYTNMWEDVLWWPSPAAMGWTNVCLEFHVYDQVVYGVNGVDDWWFTTQKRIADNMVRAFTRLREQRNVPVYVGEFAPWNEQNFDYWTRQLQANDFNWGHWNYRSWGWDNPSKPEEGKTLWGLDYRSKDTTNEMPNLIGDDLETLADRMAMYNRDNYTDNVHLQDVVARHASEPQLSKGKCEFYRHTFTAKNSESLSPNWPWNKVEGIAATNAAFKLQSGRARLRLDWGPVAMRLRSREEADARFEINDSTGCWFAVSPVYFEVTNDLSGYDAAINLCAVRDSVSKRVLDHDTKGVVARLEYDKMSSTIRVMLYAKSGGTNTYGTQLYQSGTIGFVGGTPFELFINTTSVLARYNGTNVWSGPHTNLDLASWPDGAVCVVEADEPSAGRAYFVELDDLRAERPDAQWDTLFEEPFSLYPDGIELVAEPEYASMRDIWAPSRKSKSFMTNETCAWIPEEKAKGGSWYNARRTYQNDVRLALTSTNVVEIQVAYSNFTAGICKIAFMPEPFPAELYNEYDGPVIYAEIKYQGSLLVFDLVRQWGAYDATRQWVAWANNIPYVPGQVVSLQVGSMNARIYYGTNLLVNAAHGTNAALVYAQGAFPHLEFQNDDSTTNAVVTIDSVKARHLSGFTQP